MHTDLCKNMEAVRKEVKDIVHGLGETFSGLQDDVESFKEKIRNQRIQRLKVSRHTTQEKSAQYWSRHPHTTEQRLSAY